jgi:23S rRNA (uracil1939-C5)-methyltransferase
LIAQTVDSQRFITVDVIDIALPNNYGVAKEDGHVIFIPEAVVGDRVRVRVRKEQKQVTYGSIEEIVVPSPFRVEPECPHFGFCGGCTFQNVTYEKQLQIKEGYLIETLKRIGGLDVKNIPISSIVPSPEVQYYRNKLELSFGTNDGRIALGLRERTSPFTSYEGKVLPIRKCLITSRLVERILPIFKEFMEGHGLSPYNPVTKQGFLRHLILRESKSTGEIMALLETRSGTIPDLSLLAQTLSGAVPEVRSFYWIVNNRSGDDRRSERTRLVYGKSYIEERLKGFTFKVLPGSFFQPNTRSAEILYDKIPEITDLGAGERVLGLYCGTGPIEIFLSGRTKDVAGIDSEQSNIACARENCKLNNVRNCVFYEGKVEAVLKTKNFRGTDLLVLDPPRGGVSPEGLRHVFKIHPKRIAYVSCNPSTLARDLKMIGTLGYKITGIVPFDFFPHTPHIETLVGLHR